ncbi:MAG: tetratricopeptide repeat protein [bacterium]
MNKLSIRIIDWVVYFILIVTPLLFFTDLTRNPYYTQISLLHASILIIVIVFLIDALISKKLRLIRTPLDIPIAAFAAVALVSVVVSYIKHPVEYFRFSTLSEGGNRYFFTIVNSFLAYYIAVYFVRKNQRSLVLIISIVVGVVSCFYGVLQYFGLEFIWPKVLNPFGVRSVSTFGNPNFLSSYIVMLLPITLYYYLSAREMVYRFALLFSLLVYFAALLCTLTRSSWIGVIVGIVFLFVILMVKDKSIVSKNKKFIGLLIALVIILVLFWPRSNIAGYAPTVKERFFEVKEAASGIYNPLHQRFLIWKSSWEMSRSYPFIGIGWGLLELYYPYYQGTLLYDKIFSKLRTHANNAHNEVLEILSQVGIIGFGVYLLILATFLTLSYKAFMQLKANQNESRFIIVALAAGMIGMWFDNLLNVSLHFAVPCFLYWWFMGNVVGVANDEVHGFVLVREINLQKGTAKILSILIIIISMFFIWRVYNYQAHQMAFFKGFKLSQKVNPEISEDYRGKRMLNNAIQYLKKAHSYRRLEVNNNYEMGNAYARLKDYDKAVWSYEEALRANGGYDEIYYNIATICNQQQKYDKALEFYNISYRINPLNENICTGMSNIYINYIQSNKDKEKNFKLLEDLYLSAVRVHPDERDFWNNLGWVYITTEEYDKAVDVYAQTLRIDPDFAPGRQNLEISLKRSGKTSHPFLEIDNKLENIKLLVQAAQYDEAESMLKEILEISPNHGTALMFLGNVYFSMGKYADAVSMYSRVLEKYPNSVANMRNLSAAYMKLNDFENAKNICKKIISVTKDNPNEAGAYQDALKSLSEINNALEK